MLFALIFTLVAYAGGDEAAVVKTFKKAHGVYEKFHSDTMKYRADTEAYNEKEFGPAADEMIALLGRGKCKTCLKPYLSGLSSMEGSASETLTEQLKKIISEHSKELNKACKGLGKKVRAGLTVRLRDAVSFLADERKLERKEIEARIPNCF